MSLLIYGSCIDCEWEGELPAIESHESDHPGHVVVLKHEDVGCGC